MSHLSCYLSISAQVSDHVVDVIESYLCSRNIITSKHIKGTEYNEQLLIDSHFVLFICASESVSKDRSYSKKTYENVVGKGQYSEAELCCEYEKPAFIWQRFNHSSSSLLMTKLQEKFFDHEEVQENWKTRWGWIRSYVKANGPIDLIGFLEGYFPYYSKNIDDNPSLPQDPNLLLL